MSCLVGYIINVDCGVDVGHVGHLFGVLCAHCTCLPVSVNTLHRNESVVGRGSNNSSGGNSSSNSSGGGRGSAVVLVVVVTVVVGVVQ